MTRSEFKQYMAQWNNEAVDWCQGKNWFWRLPFLVYFAYLLIRCWANPGYRSILSPLDLGIHELGHLVFSPFGQFLGIVGGTLLQLAVPLLGMINFYRQQDFFSIALCFGWLSANLFDVASYIADARTMNLPLVTPFGAETVIHDWNFLLTRTGLLRFDAVFAFVVKCLATGAMFACCWVGIWLLLQMKNSRNT